MLVWTYHSIHPTQMNPTTPEDPNHWKGSFLRYLEERGAEGWEFCGYDPAGNAVFKKPVMPPVHTQGVH